MRTHDAGEEIPHLLNALNSHGIKDLRTAADYTYPDMGAKYLMNGFIILLHAGIDPRRMDKFYDKLSPFIEELSRKGYSFVRVDQLLGF